MASVNPKSFYIKHERAPRKRTEAFFLSETNPALMESQQAAETSPPARQLSPTHKPVAHHFVFTDILWQWAAVAVGFWWGGRCCWRRCLSGTGQPSATTDRRTHRSPCSLRPPPQNKSNFSLRGVFLPTHELHRGRTGGGTGGTRKNCISSLH